MQFRLLACLAAGGDEMSDSLDCSECKMEERCERTKEVCKYPEGRIHGVVHHRLSEVELLKERLAETEQVIAAFVRACVTGQSDFAFALLESYRAKYPKGGGDE